MLPVENIQAGHGFSKHFELGAGFRRGGLLAPRYVDHVAELPIRHFDHGYETFDGHALADSVDMNGPGFIAGAMPDINGELHHGETVADEVLAKA